VREYWIIDPDARTLEIHQRLENGYGPAQKHGEHDSVTSALLPGLTISLADVFAA